jgi:hypothetical protein
MKLIKNLLTAVLPANLVVIVLMMLSLAIEKNLKDLHD